MSNTITTDNPYEDHERAMLQVIAGLIIPASSEFGVPGADDDLIFSNVLTGAIREAESIQPRLKAMSDLALSRHNAEFTALSREDQTALLGDSNNARLLHTMIRHTATAYYQDGRVLESVNLKSTPPFPGGYEVEQGDWSLLDPVKKREPFYKKV